ncbi:hypothetical protein PG994_000775 [Apiospora phragmitis]|uniref:Ecp2 effector protein-like domain-containing protein n=1 Tax=Apiospora phragmitis TaxID=2905665 RepID=A0ABR1X777_9PEZI
MSFLLSVLIFAGLCTASALPIRDAVANSVCATAAQIPNMSCVDHTSPNGTQGALYIHSNTTTTQAQAPGIQRSTAQFYPGDSGQAPITECGTAFVQDGRPDATSPDATDCVALASWAQSNTGFWTLTPDNLHADPWILVMMYGTCALVMSTVDGEVPRWAIYVGDQDVATTVQSACDKYTDANNKLDAMAVMGCNTSDGKGGEDKVQTKFWIRNSEGINTK